MINLIYGGGCDDTAVQWGWWQYNEALIKMTRMLTTEGTFQISKYTVNSNTKYQIEFLLRQYLLLDLTPLCCCIWSSGSRCLSNLVGMVRMINMMIDDNDDDGDDADNDDDGNDDEQLLVIVTKWECF